MAISTNPGIWVASLLCIGYVSVAWKDNPYARIAMETLVGASIGNALVDAILKLKVDLDPIAAGKFIAIIPIFLGILCFFRLSTRYGWISRYSTGYLMGVGAGVTAGSIVSANIVKPIRQSIISWTGLSSLEILGQIAIVITLISTLSYFVLTRPRTGGLKTVQTVGRYSIFFMMGILMAQHQNWNLGAMQGMLDIIIHQWLGIARPM